MSMKPRDGDVRRESIDSLIRHQEELRVLTDINKRLGDELTDEKARSAELEKAYGEERDALGLRYAALSAKLAKAEEKIAAMAHQDASVAAQAVKPWRDNVQKMMDEGDDKAVAALRALLSAPSEQTRRTP